MTITMEEYQENNYYVCRDLYNDNYGLNVYTVRLNKTYDGIEYHCIKEYMTQDYKKAHNTFLRYRREVKEGKY